MMKRFDLTDDLSVWELEDQTLLSPLENFEIWKDRWFDEVRTKSDSTVRSYDTVLNSFFKWVELYEDIPISEIGARYLNRYFLSYQYELAQKKYTAGTLPEKDFKLVETQHNREKNGLNDARFKILECFENTMSQRMNIIKMFLGYISRSNLEQHDFTKIFPYLVKLKIGDKITDYLTPKELMQLIKYMQIWTEIHKDHFPKSPNYYAYRNAMLLIIYATTGARGQEVIEIKLSDISEKKTNDGTEHYILLIQKAKGNKKRTITIKKEYLVKYVEYFKERLPSKDYYISSKYSKETGYVNEPMNVDHLRSFSNKVLKLINIDKTGLHAFRRGYVTKRISVDRADVSEVAKEVGNTSTILEKHYFKHNAESMLEKK